MEDRGKLEMFPNKTRIFVYEKCGERGRIPVFTTQGGGDVEILHHALPDALDPATGKEARRDECTAYLAHVVHHYQTGFSDFTLFLHGDPGDHTPWGLLNLVLRALAQGTLRDVPFIHLGTPRLVHTSNPCQTGLFEMAMARPQNGPLSTYCCSQFGVSRDRMLSRQYEEFTRMYHLVDGTFPDVCERIGPSFERYAGARLSHCFFFEFMWHVVFGEGEELPLRADDIRLPVFLRLKDNEAIMPSTWKSYLENWVGGRASFERQGHERWWNSLVEAPSLDDRTQVNYGDEQPPRIR